MAFFQMDYFSESLCFNTEVNVFIPTPNSDEILNHKKADYFKDGRKFQVLYLLHGAYGDYSDWMRLTSVERYAQDHKLAIVMPSASNSFYQDMYKGSDYLTYLSEELPQVMKAYFPISRKRENTFVAGLSMGGYGALKLAFEHTENYAACASLSGAIDIQAVMKSLDAGNIEGPFDFNRIFKDPNRIEGTNADLIHLIQKRIDEKVMLPRVYQTVGTEDFIYKANQSAREKLEKMPLDYTYEEKTGIHDWKFWDMQIERVMDWLSPAYDSVEE